MTLTAVDTGCTPYANVNFDITYNATSQKWEGNFTVNACGTNLTQTFKFYCVVGKPNKWFIDVTDATGTADCHLGGINCGPYATCDAPFDFSPGIFLNILPNCACCSDTGVAWRVYE